MADADLPPYAIEAKIAAYAVRSDESPTQEFKEQLWVSPIDDNLAHFPSVSGSRDELLVHIVANEDNALREYTSPSELLLQFAQRVEKTPEGQDIIGCDAVRRP